MKLSKLFIKPLIILGLTTQVYGGDGMGINGPDGIEGQQFEAVPVVSGREIDLYKVFEAERKCYDMHFIGKIKDILNMPNDTSSGAATYVAEIDIAPEANADDSGGVRVREEKNLKKLPFQISGLKADVKYVFRTVLNSTTFVTNREYSEMNIRVRHRPTSYMSGENFKYYGGPIEFLIEDANGIKRNWEMNKKVQVPHFSFNVKDIDFKYDELESVVSGRKVVKNLTLHKAVDTNESQLFSLIDGQEDRPISRDVLTFDLQQIEQCLLYEITN